MRSFCSSFFYDKVKSKATNIVVAAIEIPDADALKIVSGEAAVKYINAKIQA